MGHDGYHPQIILLLLVFSSELLVLFETLYLSFLDFTGYIIVIWSVKRKNANEYIAVKVKTGVHHYSTIRIMKSQNPNPSSIKLKCYPVILDHSSPEEAKSASIEAEIVHSFVVL